MKVAIYKMARIEMGDTNDTSFKLKQRGTEENYNGK